MSICHKIGLRTKELSKSPLEPYCKNVRLTSKNGLTCLEMRVVYWENLALCIYIYIYSHVIPSRHDSFYYIEYMVYFIYLFFLHTFFIIILFYFILWVSLQFDISQCSFSFLLLFPFYFFTFRRDMWVFFWFIFWRMHVVTIGYTKFHTTKVIIWHVDKNLAKNHMYNPSSYFLYFFDFLQMEKKKL